MYVCIYVYIYIYIYIYIYLKIRSVMTRGLVRESEKVACHHPELTEGTEKNSCLGCLKQDYELLDQKQHIFECS